MDKNDKNKPIALFDSGVGGLTVYKELKKLLPKEDYLYFGDTFNMPYGEKTPEELLIITKRIFDFFELKHVKAVVMACNTSSAICYDRLKDKYNFQIYPIIQSVSKVLSDLNAETLGVFATPATVNSHAYAKYLNGKKVFEIACPDWVKIVENNEINTPLSLGKVRQCVLEMQRFLPDKIILGCTHYPYLSPVLKHYFRSENIINPAEYFAKYIKNDLTAHDLINQKSKGSEKFYVSSNPEQFKMSAKMFYELNSPPKLIKV